MSGHPTTETEARSGPRLRPILIALLAALLASTVAATSGAAQQGDVPDADQQKTPEQGGATGDPAAGDETLSVDDTAQKVTVTPGCVVVTTPDQDIAIGEACEDAGGGETTATPPDSADGSTKPNPKAAPTPDAAPEGSAKDTLTQIIEQCSTEAREAKKPESTDRDAAPETTTAGTTADKSDDDAERQGEESGPQGDQISTDDGLSEEECQKLRAALSPEEDQQATDNDELSDQPASGPDDADAQNDTPGDDAKGDEATDGDEKDNSVSSGTGDPANETPSGDSTRDDSGTSDKPEESQDDQEGPADSIEVKIARVIDGDTVELAEEVEGNKTVRLIGVDTPEMTPGGSDTGAPNDENPEDTGDPREDASSDKASSDGETPEAETPESETPKAEAPKAEAPEEDPAAEDNGTFGEDATKEDATPDESEMEEEPSEGKSSSFGMLNPSIFFTKLAYTGERAAEEAGAEPHAEEASAFTTEQLEGETVTLEPDEDHEDDHGRLLAYVWLDEELFNELLLEKGYGELLIIEPNTLHEERLKAAEAKAKEENLGIWGLDAETDDGSGSGAAKPDTAEPKATSPEATSPEATSPKGPKPEAAKPEAAKPETKQPEAVKPEATKPEMGTFGGQKPKAPGVKPPAAQAHDALPAEKKEELNKQAESNRPTAFVKTEDSDGNQQLNLPETGGQGVAALPQTGGVSLLTAWPLFLVSAIGAIATGLVLLLVGRNRLRGRYEA